MAQTCCPAYTIRLDCKAFKASKQQRQVATRFLTYLRQGAKPRVSGYGPGEANPSTTIDTKIKGKPSTKQGSPFDIDRFFEECASGATQHRFTLELEPASFTAEKFELYRRYQVEIHKDPESKVTTAGLKSFLCKGPMELEKRPMGAQAYGQYHQLYRLDGKLIAFAVIDILPKSVSSVYFVWDPDYRALSLGKLSALQEIALARRLDLPFYYMGYYIHSCPKMKYKAEYSPSYLLDPTTHAFYPFSTCKPLLNSYKYPSFSNPDRSQHPIGPQAANASPSDVAHAPEAEDSKAFKSDEEGASESDSEDDHVPDDLPPGFLPLQNVSRLQLDPMRIYEDGLVFFANSRARENAAKEAKLQQLYSAIGPELAERVIVYLG